MHAMQGDEVRARLERIVNSLQRGLDDVGLLDEGERQRMFLIDGTFSPKLHATVINTRLRRGVGRTAAGATSENGGRKLTPAEIATTGVSVTTATGKMSAKAAEAQKRKTAGLKRAYGERVPVDACESPHTAPVLAWQY